MDTTVSRRVILRNILSRADTTCGTGVHHETQTSRVWQARRVRSIQNSGMAQGKGDPSSVSQFSKTKSSNYFFLIKFFETSSEISVCITKLAFKGLFTLTMPLNMQHYVCLYCISENADTAWCLAANYACMPCDLKDTIPKAFINSYYQNLVRTLKKNLQKILSLY